MKKPGQRRDRTEEILGVLAIVDDDQDLRTAYQLIRDHLVADRLGKTRHLGALEIGKELIRPGSKFALGTDHEPKGPAVTPSEGTIHGAQGGLGCRAENNAAVVVAGQLVERCKTWQEKMQRKRLDLVQDDDAASDVMELATA